MQRSDIVREVASRTGIKSATVDTIVASFFDVVVLALRCDDDVTLRNFGKFAPRLRRAREAELHFEKTTSVALPDRVTVAFIPSVVLKRQINGG